MTLGATATSSVLGFALSIVLARLLGPTGAGVVLQAVAAFTITLGVVRLGLDTTAVWLLPRLVANEPLLVRQAVVALLVPATVAPLVVGALWFGISWLGGGLGLDPDVHRAMSFVVLFLPPASVMTVALAATRAFGGVVPFNLVGNVIVPALRPLLVWAIVASGGTAAAAALGWGVPWLVGAVLALAVIMGQLRRHTSETGGSWRPGSDVRGRIKRFALPRVVASALDQGITWIDVVLVGLLIGSTAAGVYGTVSRFVNAGAMVATALRIVVAPRFSALLGEDDVRGVERLYTATARWILLLGSPAYVVLAVFAPTVLGWLGGGFADGRVPMIVLCLGSIVVLAAGNVQALLLMSGASAASAVNKAVVLTFNVVANIVLVPRVGIVGAAAAWAASMALDTALAAWQVRRRTGVSVAVKAIGYVMVVVIVVVATPAVLVAVVLGQGTWQLLLAVLVGGVALLGYAFADRRRLELDQLRLIRKAGR